jgi:hypothetical protein
MITEEMIQEWLATEALNPETWAPVERQIEELRQEREERIRAHFERLKAETPGAGSGLHFHMCTVANYIRHHVDVDEGEEILERIGIDGGYSQRKASYHAKQLRRKWDEAEMDKTYVRTPKITEDIGLIKEIVYGSSLTVDQVKAGSPVKVDPADTTAATRIAEMLFPDDDIVCVAKERARAYCYRLSEFAPLDQASFIVPNPMREEGEYQLGIEWKSGLPSSRCQANVAYRRWFVIEADISRYDRSGEKLTFWASLIDQWETDGISIMDVQARLIQALTGDQFELAMIVWSGNKSLQSWWPVGDATEDEVLTFISRAMRLGADRAAKTTSQYFRVPAGWNHDKNCRQAVLYLDPTVFNQGDK